MGGHNFKKEKLKFNQIKNNNIDKRIDYEKKEKIRSINSKLEKIFLINNHTDWVESVKIFPSGNIISVSDDRSINIFDGNNFNILQNIKNAHYSNIINISIKDENNFATCSNDKSIKIWTKKANKFIEYKTIIKAHKDSITNLIYLLSKKIISCSKDRTIKIRDLSNNKNQLITSIKLNFNFGKNYLLSLLLLEDKKILVNAGDNGTFFWKISKKGIIIKYIHRFSSVICTCWNGLNRIDEDRIIVGCEKELNIISIKDKNIIKSIKIPFRCNGITAIKEKGIFLVGGWSKDILIYSNHDYKCILTTKNAHNDYIVGFCQLKNNLILSFSGDYTMKIWALNK